MILLNLSGIESASGEDESGIEPSSGEDQSGQDESGIESGSRAGMFCLFLTYLIWLFYSIIILWRCHFPEVDFEVIKTHRKPSKNQISQNK